VDDLLTHFNSWLSGMRPCKSSSVVCLASDAVCKWDATPCDLVIALQTMIRLLSLQLKETSSLGSIL